MRTSTTTPRKSCRSHAAPDPRRRCSTRHPPRPICIRRLIPPLDEWIHRAARNSLYRLSGSQGEESVGTARAPEKKARPVRVKEERPRSGRTRHDIRPRLCPVHSVADLGEIHVFCLQALGPILYYEGYARTLIERTVPTCRNGGKMDENIFAILALNKPKSFCGVKPLYASCFFQRRLLI